MASIMDLFSRWIIGWAMADRIDSKLVEKAWEMAVLNRHPKEPLLHHSDRGSQYTSDAYLQLLKKSQLHNHHEPFWQLL